MPRAYGYAPSDTDMWKNPLLTSTMTTSNPALNTFNKSKEDFIWFVKKAVTDKKSYSHAAGLRLRPLRHRHVEEPAGEGRCPAEDVRLHGPEGHRGHHL